MVGKKEITVYWSCMEYESLRCEEPVNVYKNFIKKDIAKNTGLLFCPAFKDELQNTFGMKSLYDYNFKIKDLSVISNDYNQNFFNDHVNIRSISDKVFSFRQGFIFFTEEDSLEMSIGLPPFLEKSYIDNPYSTISGKVNIGKWFRLTDFAFILNNSNEFILKENDIFQYIKFHTDKKIIFKQFIFDYNIRKYTDLTENAKNNRILKFRKLEEYYKMLKNKKGIIKTIKENLID